MTRTGTAVAAAIFAFAVAGGAQAATCTAGSGGSAATFTITPTFATGANGTGAECYAGNDTNTIDSNFSMFGMTGWLLADKNDDGTSGSPISFDTAPTNGAKSGSWSILNPSNIPLANIIVTLKAGGGFGAFDVSALSGLWSSSKGLSHASVYYKPGDGVPAIPLPASVLLLLGGMGGMGGLGALRALKRESNA